MEDKKLMTMPLTDVLSILELYRKSNGNSKKIKQIIKQLNYELKNTTIDTRLLKSSAKKGGIVALGALILASVYQSGISFGSGIESELVDYLKLIIPSGGIGASVTAIDYSIHNNKDIETILSEATRNFKILNNQLTKEFFGIDINSIFTNPDLIAVDHVNDNNGHTYEVIACIEDVYTTSDIEPEIYTGIILPVVKDKKLKGYFFQKANLEDFGLNANWDKEKGIVITKKLDKYKNYKPHIRTYKLANI